MATNPVGATLADRIAAGALPVKQALRFAIEIAEQVKTLNQQGLAHGWICGRAILVSSDGLKLSPPSARHVISPEADIRGLGALLFEMLTGRRPKEGVIEVRIPGAPPGVETSINSILQRCWTANPERRWQSMQKLCIELKLVEAQVVSGQAAEPAAPAPEPKIIFNRPVPPPPPSPPPAKPQPKAEDEPKPEPKERPADPKETESPEDEAHEEDHRHPAPAQLVFCPNCGGQYVFTSRVRSGLETICKGLGGKVYRCHQCYFRFLRFMGMTLRRTKRY